ncbi:ATP-binding protein [Streptomyces kunmingensis]|uniref:ATP-binding protein n=1 Tax=Streptomyces kunmingensis TaxID=68225 RepID=A0ABU6C7F7_9ACTN|nr:ATP-binding protein [Streptomyces kunmingensis]
MAVAGHGDPSAVPLLECLFSLRDLPRLRLLIDEYAHRAGLAEPRRGEFVVAVDAVATNAIEHGGGGGTLILRRVDGRLECQIRDCGPGFTDEVIPAHAPHIGDRTAGHGLWLASLVTDHFTVSAGSIGSIVALAMRLPH